MFLPRKDLIIIQPLIARRSRIANTRVVRFLLTPVVMFALYRVVLDVSYRLVLSPIFGYMGFTYSFSFVRWIGIYALSVATYYAVSMPHKTTSALSIEIFLWFIYGPFSCFYALSGRDITFYIYMTLCFLAMRLFFMCRWERLWERLARALSPVISRAMRYRDGLGRLLWWGMIGGCALWTAMSIIALLLYADLSNWAAAFDLLRVYEIRSAQTLPTWVGYLFSAQTNVINVFALCLLIQKRKYWAMLFPIAVQLLFYFSLGNKSDLFGPVLCLFISLAMRFRRTSAVIGGAFTLGTAGLTLLAFISRVGLVPYSLFRRTFFTQALLSFNYFDFFTGHAKLYFSEGRIGRLLGLTYPYPISSSKLMMANYDGSLSGGANGFFMASGFADMGFPGMLICCGLLCLLLAWLDRVTDRLPAWFAVTVLTLCLYTLCNTNLLTTLGTHGMLLAIVLLTAYSLYARLGDGKGESLPS